MGEQANNLGPVLVFDFETTGVDVETDAPVSAAVAEIVKGAPPKVILDTKCNPGRPIPEEASKVHGITDADVADAPSWLDVCVDLAKLFEGATAVVAYNASFDASIFRRGCREAGFEPPFVRWWCPLEWARDLWWGSDPPRPYPTDPETGKRRLRLEDLARFFGVPIEAHTARGDVLATAGIMAPLRRRIEDERRRRGMPSPFSGGDRAPEGAIPVPPWVLGITSYTQRCGLRHEEVFARMAKRDGREPEPSRWAKLYGKP